MNLYDKATGAARDLLSSGLIARVAGFQSNPVRKALFESLGTRLDDALRNATAPAAAETSTFERLATLLEALRSLKWIGFMKDLRSPPLGAQAQPMDGQQLRQVDSIEAKLDDVLEAADAIADPAAPALSSPGASPDSRSVRVLRELLAVSKTDAWSLGSDRLDRALAEARSIVEAAGPEYVIFSAEEFERDGDGAGFWSNDEGWTVLEEATVFLDQERYSTDLPHPIDARWMSLAEAHGNELVVGGVKP